LLTNSQELSAIIHNKSKLQDIRAIRIVQELVKATSDGIIGVGTVERLAQFQNSKSLTATGKLDVTTLRSLWETLSDQGHFNAIICLLIDFFDLDQFFSIGLGLLEISRDDDLIFSDRAAAGGVTLSWAKVTAQACSIIRIRSSSLGNFDNASRILVHELAHMEQNYKPRNEFVAKGIEEAGFFDSEQEFLGNSQALIHPGLPRSGDVLFFNSAELIIKRFWKDMFTQQKQFYWSRFEKIRNAVSQQFDTLPSSINPQQRSFFQDVVTQYNNEQKP